MMRWWWFGPAVAKPELERELRSMKAGGIGGVEIQPVYPLALDGNLPYLSDEFIDALRFAANKARELGFRVDITLGSGWPYGGPHVPVGEAASRLRVERVRASSGTVSLPSMEQGEELIAEFLDGKQRTIDRGRVEVGTGSHEVLFFISSRTGQQVKRAAVNAEGFVLDHYDRAAVEHHLRLVADRLMQAFGTHPPYAVFSDSLEVYDSNWTPDFLEEFQKRRGYDLIPLLPALVGDFGPKTLDVRRDWGRTLTELAEERYLTPVREWAKAHGTRFRSQTYGLPPVILSSNALVDLPEGEGWHWRGFSTARWASSASHLYSRPVTSSETWTWLHSPAFRATPLDMKAEADLHFLQGVNQIIGHGWPYSPPSEAEPGWRFYAAGAFNDHNPWYFAMPEIAKYLQRVSFLLRQGKPATDVALYLPTEDAWSQFTVGSPPSVSQEMEALLGPDLTPKILDAGFNFDFIDDRAIAKVGIPYPVLVLPALKRMPPETAGRIDNFKKQGGIVVEAGRIGELAHLYTPDFATGNPAIGFIHRKLADADVYFVVNTGNRAVDAVAQARSHRQSGEFWDPVTGKISAAGGSIRLNLEPYESRFLVFSDAPAPKENLRPTVHGDTVEVGLNLSTDWKLTFPALRRDVTVPRLLWWTEDAATRFVSGRGEYEKSFTVPEAYLSRSHQVVISLGEGDPVEPSGRAGPGMHALLESPVHEAAAVFMNGQRAGAVWCPPYQVDVTGLVHAGANTIRIEVGNLAINELAGQTMPDYKLLSLRYGVRFQAQDMENLQPLPSGLTGPITLIAR